MKITRLVLGVYLVAVMATSWGANSLLTVTTQTPINMGQTRDVTGALAGLSTAAREAGLGDATLHGSVSYAKQGKEMRATIRWDSLKWGQSNTEGAIGSPLVSEFATSDKRVEPETQLSARGDVSALTDTFNAVKQRATITAQKEASPVGGASKDTSAANTSVSGGYVPGSVGDTTGTTGGTGNSSTGGVTTNQNTTTWVSCGTRVDNAAGVVYLQAQQQTTDQNGTVVSTGDCVDHGGTVPLQRDYTTCPMSFDFTNAVAYAQYTTYAVIGGTTTTMDSACAVDLSRATPLQAKFSGCGVRFDFANKVGVQQEQLWYYDPAGNVQNVGDCRDSSTTYPLTMTAVGCTDTVDTQTGTVIPYEHWKYSDNTGSTQYATDCAATTTTAIPIQTEFCDPKYQNDFVNHVSYRLIDTYYIDANGQKQTVQGCHVDPTISFSHQFDASGCGVTNDDTNLITHWSAKTYINTPDDGQVVIHDCSEYQSPTPYTYIGSHNAIIASATTTWPWSSNTWTGNGLLQGVDTSDPLFSCTSQGSFLTSPVYTTPTNYTSFLVNACTDRTKVFYVAISGTADALTPRRRLNEHYMDYLRGDGTTFNRVVGREYILDSVDNAGNVVGP